MSDDNLDNQQNSPAYNRKLYYSSLVSDKKLSTGAPYINGQITPDKIKYDNLELLEKEVKGNW